MMTSVAVPRMRLFLLVVLAFAFAGLCATAAYGYLDHRVDLTVAR